MQPRDITMVIQNLIQRELLELQVQKMKKVDYRIYESRSFFEKLSHILKQQSMETKEQNSRKI